MHTVLYLYSTSSQKLGKKSPVLSLDPVTNITRQRPHYIKYKISLDDNSK